MDVKDKVERLSADVADLREELGQTRSDLRELLGLMKSGAANGHNGVAVVGGHNGRDSKHRADSRSNESGPSEGGGLKISQGELDRILFEAFAERKAPAGPSINSGRAGGRGPQPSLGLEEMAQAIENAKAASGSGQRMTMSLAELAEMLRGSGGQGSGVRGRGGTEYGVDERGYGVQGTGYRVDETDGTGLRPSREGTGPGSPGVRAGQRQPAPQSLKDILESIRQAGQASAGEASADPASHEPSQTGKDATGRAPLFQAAEEKFRRSMYRRRMEGLLPKA